MIVRTNRPIFLLVLALSLLLPSFARADPAGKTEGDDRWTELIGPGGLGTWKRVAKKIRIAGDAELAPGNPKRLVAKPGTGVLVVETKAGVPNLVTKESFSDFELHGHNFTLSRSRALTSPAPNGSRARKKIPGRPSGQPGI